MPKLRESNEVKISRNAKAVIVSEALKMGWDKKHLAEVCKMDVQKMYAILRNPLNAKLCDLTTIADKLHITLNDLVGN